MTEDTKELVKALVEGFSNSINNLTVKLATKDDLKHEIKQVEDSLDKRIKQVEDRLEKQIKQETKQVKVELMKAMKQQTSTLLEALGKYETLTEKHNRILGNIKKSFDEENK